MITLHGNLLMAKTPSSTPPSRTAEHPPAASWQPLFWQQHPGFAAIAPAATQICDWPEWPAPDRYYPKLSEHASVRFVGVDVLSYEDHVAETGEVPTRHASWHDLLNALVWHRFPASKLALNRLHQLARLTAGSVQRGRRRDAATLFDENGAVVFSDDPELLSLIRQMDWPQLFWQRRHEYGVRWQVLLFGHGLLDQLRQPFLGLTAHALLLPLSAAVAADAQAADAAIADCIACESASWTPAQLAPLPILGIPGWWPENDNEAFYDNRQYFRRERRRQQTLAPSSDAQ